MISMALGKVLLFLWVRSLSFSFVSVSSSKAEDMFVVVDVGKGSIWSDGKGCAVGAFPSRMTVGILIDGA